MLDFALRCTKAGHHPRVCMAYDKETKLRVRTGDGLIEKIEREEWAKHVNWADLIVMSDNVKWLKEVDVYRKKGYPVFAPSWESAQLELERGKGQDFLRKAGIKVPDYEVFRDYRKAEEHVRAEMKQMVSKPMGDRDKALSYVSKSPADMCYMLQRWAKLEPVCKPFLLQEFVGGIEFAVNGWLGRKGFAKHIEESFEHKKLMNDDYGPNCFPEDSEVLTRNGWKFWPDVTSEDEVCTLKDGEVTYEVPSKLVIGNFDGELIGWQSSYADILVTPGHNMYVQDDHSRNEFFFEPAHETESKKRNVLRGAGVWNGKDDRAQLPAFVNADFSSWCALLGAYIADGSTKERSVVFGGCPEHKQKKFVQFAEACGYTAKMYGSELYINSKDLATYFKTLGNSLTKTIPLYVMDAGTESISAFLEGYGAGDGTSRNNNLVYTTISKVMADQLQELCLKVGWCANVKVRDRRGESHEVDGYQCINRHVCYEVGVSKDRLKAEVNPEISYRQRYAGKVYCVTVTSHIIYVRRNGKSCFLGQTGEMGTCVKYVGKSLLAEQVLLPLEGALMKMGHTGSVNVSVIINEEGEPLPLEFTCRAGWPAFHIVQTLHPDPCEWMVHLLDGDDTFAPSLDHAIGVVMAIPDFPYNQFEKKKVSGIPIYNLDDENEYRDYLAPCDLESGTAPAMEGDEIVDKRLFVSCGDYLCVATGCGDSVREAQEEAYKAVDSLEIPNNVILRTDIGAKMKKRIPQLQEYGYATDWVY